MNDNAIATSGGTSRVALGGLAQRLVQDGLLEEAAMQDAIRRDLNPLFKIHAVVVVDALPRTASNKVMRRVLRDRYTASL